MKSLFWEQEKQIIVIYNQCWIKMEQFLYLYNTYSKKKEKITKRENQPILMYTCGPTIYDFAHIGNFRTYVFEDLLRRSIKHFFGEKNIKQVMNITDIDDKTIKGALKNKSSLKEYTQPFKKAFFEDIEKLNIEKVEHYPEATNFISEMIDIIKTLLEEGYAYVGHDKSIYFSISKFPKYGKLSHLNLDDLKKGASNRVSSDEYDKENASDFVLWKSYDEKRDGNIFWESPFGKGRPGWHIECSAMSIALLGKTIDIHCGGVDNIFPHHENEIAQSESFTKEIFVRYWVHSEHLLVDNKKMSKSLNNFYTLRDLIKMGYSGQEIRYLLLQSHYRMQLNFTMDGLIAARSSLRRISDFINRVRSIEIKDIKPSNFEKILSITKDKFYSSIADDLNISAALCSLFDFIRDINSLIDDDKISCEEANRVIVFLNDLDKILGVLPLKEEKLNIPKEIIDAANNRQIARQNKDWKKADEFRDFIQNSGFILEDSPNGPVIKKK
jgi:cysteinyl-tRNA synthetase